MVLALLALVLVSHSTTSLSDYCPYWSLYSLTSLLFTLNSLIAFWVVMLFVIILTIGFVYEWFHGALSLSLSLFRL